MKAFCGFYRLLYNTGTEKLDQLYARFSVRKRIVRPQFARTHAIACALYGSLRPGGRFVADRQAL